MSTHGTDPTTSTGGVDPEQVDPVDAQAAEIDPRDPDAPEQIEELVETAEAEGRDVPRSPADVDVPPPDTLPASS